MCPTPSWFWPWTISTACVPPHVTPPFAVSYGFPGSPTLGLRGRPFPHPRTVCGPISVRHSPPVACRPVAPVASPLPGSSPPPPFPSPSPQSQVPGPRVSISNVYPMQTRSKSGIVKPKPILSLVTSSAEFENPHPLRKLSLDIVGKQL